MGYSLTLSLDTNKDGMHQVWRHNVWEAQATYFKEESDCWAVAMALLMKELVSKPGSPKRIFRTRGKVGRKPLSRQICPLTFTH